MSSIKETISVLYDDNILSKYNMDEMDIDSARETMTEKEFVILLCHKLEYWLDINKIYKICDYYNQLMLYMKNHKVEFDSLEESCQLIITVAKYYVKAVYTVREVYNL